MNRAFFIFITTITFICSQAFTAVHEGAVGSGGGNSCYIDGKPILLDLVTHPVSLVKYRAPVKLKVTQVMDKLGFDRIDLKRTSLFEDILSTINGLNKSPKTSKLLLAALEGFEVYGTRFLINKPIKASFKGQKLCGKHNTKATIFYNKSFMFISVPEFNKHDYSSQKAMVIHELLRQVQIRFERNGDDEILQKLTSQIYSKAEVLQLDNHQFFFKQQSTSDKIFNKICSAQKINFEDSFAAVQETKTLARKLDYELRHFCKGIGPSVDKVLKVAREVKISSVSYEWHLPSSAPKREQRKQALASFEISLLKLRLEAAQLQKINNAFEKNAPRLQNATEGLANIPLKVIVENPAQATWEQQQKIKQSIRRMMGSSLRVNYFSEETEEERSR